MLVRLTITCHIAPRKSWVGQPRRVCSHHSMWQGSGSSFDGKIEAQAIPGLLVETLLLSPERCQKFGASLFRMCQAVSLHPKSPGVSLSLWLLKASACHTRQMGWIFVLYHHLCPGEWHAIISPLLKGRKWWKKQGLDEHARLLISSIWNGFPM